MSNEQQAKANLTVNTALTALGVILLSVVGYALHVQIESITAGQENMKLTIENEMNAGFETKAAHDADISKIDDWNKGITVSASATASSMAALTIQVSQMSQKLSDMNNENNKTSK